MYFFVHAVEVNGHQNCLVMKIFHTQKKNGLEAIFVQKMLANLQTANNTLN